MSASIASTSVSKPSAKPAGRRYRGVSVAQRRDERRQRLLEAGQQVFGSQGFHAATVKMLCATAGLTERYFYESFESREAMFLAVVERGSKAMQQHILAAVAALPTDANAQQVARTALKAYYRLLKDECELARLLLFETLGVSEDINRRYYEGLDEFSQFLLLLAAPIAERGELQFRHEELVATGLVGATQHIATRWILRGYAQPLDEVVEAAFAIYASVLQEFQR